MPNETAPADGTTLNALRIKLQAAVAPDTAFLNASGETRYSIGVPGVAEAAQAFYVMLASGFVGAVLMEVVKGTVKLAGSALGAKLQGLLSHAWGETEARDPAALQEAHATLAASRQALSEEQFANALAVARTALQTRLMQDGFPPARAEKLAAAIGTIAAADHV